MLLRSKPWSFASIERPRTTVPKRHSIFTRENVILKFFEYYQNIVYIKKNYDIFLNLIYLILKFFTVIMKENYIFQFIIITIL